LSNQAGRSTAFSNAISSFFGVPQNTLANLGSQAEGKFNTKASSKVQQTGTLTTKLAGRVVKVYPNRTMLIEANCRNIPLLILLLVSLSLAERIKDIATIEGNRVNYLQGYGLVVWV